jgi:hypothetical protein
MKYLINSFSYVFTSRLLVPVQNQNVLWTQFPKGNRESDLDKNFSSSEYSHIRTEKNYNIPIKYLEFCPAIAKGKHSEVDKLVVPKLTAPGFVP